MIEYKSRVDDKLKLCLQHGAFNSRGNGAISALRDGKLYILDFAYPFSPIQAFAFALGVQTHDKHCE